MSANEDLASNHQDQESATKYAGLPSGINLEELAKKIFEILLQELEIENDRTGKQS